LFLIRKRAIRGGRFITGEKVIIDSGRSIYVGSGLVTNDSLVIRKYADFTGGIIGRG